MSQADQIFQLPINLNRLELRNAVLQNLSSPPTAKTGLMYYSTTVDSPGHFNSLGVWVPWDASKYTNLPNTVLANSSVTIGSTNVALGATAASLAGLTSIAATTITGALVGNASTATKLAAAVTLNLSGVTATGASFDGSGNATIAVTGVPSSLLTGTISSAISWALTGDVTSAAGSSVTVIGANKVTLAKLATQAANTLIGNGTGATATPTAITLSGELGFTAGVLGVAAGGITNAMLANTTVTIGTTAVTLGSSVSVLAGLTSVAATTFTGALTGNAATATKLATARTIGTTGITSTAASFDGSGNVTIGVTALPASLITGTISPTLLGAFTGDVTSPAGSAVLTIATGAVTNAKMANSSLTVGTTAISLGAAATTIAGLVSVTSTSFTGALVGNASTATKWAAPVTVAISGGATAAGVNLDGSGAISLVVTALDASKLTGSTTSSHISDLATVVQAYSLDKFANPVANINMGGYLINNLGPGVAGTDAVNLNQLNSAISTGASGLTPHNSVRLATAAAITTLSGLLTIDGKVTVAGDRVLVKDCTTASKNGIYIAAAGAWVLASDSTQGNMVTGSMMLVTDGNTLVGSQWWLTTAGTITIGTTALTYSEYGLNNGQIFGNGLTTTGATTSVKPDVGIVVTSTGVAIDTTTVVRKVTATIGDGTSTAFGISHTLATMAVTVSIINNSTGQFEICGITVTSASVVTITFAVAPATNSYTVVIHG